MLYGLEDSRVLCRCDNLVVFTSDNVVVHALDADAALGDNRKPIKRKLPKTHKLRDEQAEPRTFKGHGVRDNRLEIFVLTLILPCCCETWFKTIFSCCCFPCMYLIFVTGSHFV